MCGRYHRKSDNPKIAEAFHRSKVNNFVLPRGEIPSSFDLADGKMTAFADPWDAWKDPANDRPPAFPADEMGAFEVGKDVGQRPRSPELLNSQ